MLTLDCCQMRPAAHGTLDRYVNNTKYKNPRNLKQRVTR